MLFTPAMTGKREDIVHGRSIYRLSVTTPTHAFHKQIPICTLLMSNSTFCVNAMKTLFIVVHCWHFMCWHSWITSYHCTKLTQQSTQMSVSEVISHALFTRCLKTTIKHSSSKWHVDLKLDWNALNYSYSVPFSSTLMVVKKMNSDRFVQTEHSNILLYECAINLLPDNIYSLSVTIIKQMIKRAAKCWIKWLYETIVIYQETHSAIHTNTKQDKTLWPTLSCFILGWIVFLTYKNNLINILL